jgi:hypothetical protein
LVSPGAVRPDEFAKNRPKCSPTSFLSILMLNFFRGK